MDVPFSAAPRPARRVGASLLLALLLGTAGAAPARAQAADDARAGGGAEITYEIFVQSFSDADGDGIGDFAGMASRLDYIESLGAGAVWLMPIQPSPSYHKYDVTDYRDVHPDYGTLEAFKAFVDEAHAHGIRVIMDQVFNHTSREHPWFQSALEGPSSPYRDYYVWATPEEVASGAPAAARGGELVPGQWHDAPGDEDYYGFFWSGMPDLNLDNPAVREEIVDIGRFWLEEVGVDGFRLDAARHIYPDARAADSHAWWVEFREAMEAVKEDVYLVGEVWDTAENAAPYFRGLDALFNFDLSFALQRALQTGRGDSLAVLHEQARDAYRREAGRFTDATFLTNHDQSRIRSVLGGSLQLAEMGASLLFTLPGDPYVYYGEEIGMLGAKPDPLIREPFLWAPSPDAERATWIDPVFSTDETVAPVSVQEGQPESILAHYRQLAALRLAHPALAHGEVEAVATGRPQIAAFVRTDAARPLLVVHNVSTEPVAVDLPQHLNAFRERVWAHTAGRSVDEPAALAGRRLTMPGLSTVILQQP